ncbi:hypothetical protein [Lacticaseibacillus absianus]|uniref:hypothetical protein n=1 Tax=Lacticaseibacillus absianus TaxID=2729623 RepID=UPI0015C89E41|nr:hypothetical protein [Lacticaseibacillus absianus]
MTLDGHKLRQVGTTTAVIAGSLMALHFATPGAPVHAAPQPDAVAAAATLTIQYVNVADNNALVAVSTLTGQIGNTGTFAVVAPNGYVRSADQPIAVSYTLTAAEQTLTIRVQPKATSESSATQTGRATLNIVDETGALLAQQHYTGTVGTAIAFNVGNVLLAYTTAGYQVQANDTLTPATFTATPATFTIRLVAPAAASSTPATASSASAASSSAPVASTPAAPAAPAAPPEPSAPAKAALPALTPAPEADPPVAFGQTPLRALTQTMPATKKRAKHTPTEKLAPRAILNPQIAFGLGPADPTAATQLAEYFISLAGKINYGLRRD